MACLPWISKGYHLSERHYGTFERAFNLPKGIDADKIDARFSKGVLSISLPKKAEAMKTDKLVPISRQGAFFRGYRLGQRRRDGGWTNSRLHGVRLSTRSAVEPSTPPVPSAAAPSTNVSKAMQRANRVISW